MPWLPWEKTPSRRDRGISKHAAARAGQKRKPRRNRRKR